VSRIGFALLLSALLLVSGCLHAVSDPVPPAQVEGCTDSSALNYDANATVDDGSCEYPPPPPPPVEGCTDPAALNYGANATVDDGSCEYPPPPPPVVPGITELFLNEHRVVWNNTSDESQYLYVFLPGSGQNTSDERTRWTVLAAAEVGMRGIGLSYQNQGMVISWCEDENDSNCMEKVRTERIYGQDTSTLVECNYSESVYGLLIELLEDLDAAYPDMGWTNWITANGTPDWSKIVLGGHSQGGGNAALIARDHEVARVVMYAASFDYDATQLVDAENETYTPPSWISDPHVTPSNRYYAAFHVEDNAPHTFILTGNLEILLNLTAADSVDVFAANGVFPEGSRLFHAQNTLNQNQSAHTYMLLQQFMALHEFMLSDGIVD